MALKLPAKIFLFLQKMNLRTLYFKPIVASTLVQTHYPTAIWDEVWTAPAAVPAHVGADSRKKPHHIVTLRFSEVVKNHAK